MHVRVDVFYIDLFCVFTWLSICESSEVVKNLCKLRGKLIDVINVDLYTSTGCMGWTSIVNGHQYELVRI